MSKTRTDAHRPGAIIPAEYAHVLSYNMSTSRDGWPVPSYGVTCALDRRVDTRDAKGNVTHTVNGEHDANGLCCVVGLLHVAKVTFAHTGATGQCSVCSTHFVYGDVWRHEPSGDYIHLGHTCADKYDLLHDRSAFELEADRRAAATARECIRQEKNEIRTAFLVAHEGLESALETDHRIVADIKQRFVQNCKLSDKQIALVMKLAAEKAAGDAHVSHTTPVAGCPRCDKAVAEEKALHSEYVGKVGERLVLTVKLEKVLEFEGGFGTSYLHIFTDAAGNSIKWFGSSRLSAEDYKNVPEGTTVTVKATVKKHDEYRGKKQTSVNRVMIHLSKPAKAKKASIRTSVAA